MLMTQTSTNTQHKSALEALLMSLVSQIFERMGTRADAAPPVAKATSAWPNYGPPMPPAPAIRIMPGVDVSEHAVSVLRGVLVDAGSSSATITSGRRSVQDQARIMYTNLVTFGVARQREVYAKSGEYVIDAYEKAKAAGKTPEAIQQAMVAAILEIGPTRVSNHLNPDYDTFDVGTSSISNGTAFVAALERAKQAGTIVKYLVEGKGMAFHLDVRRS
jgi:hypothetical protein